MSAGAMVRYFFRRFSTRIALFLLLVGGYGATARAQTVISGTYNGVTIEGDISIAASTTATFTGGTTFTGTNANLGKNGTLFWKQDGTLSGKNLVFGSGAILIIDFGRSLTLTSNTTVTGSVQLQSYAEGDSTSAITNEGTIINNSGFGRLFAGRFSNTGSITASGGTTFGIGSQYGGLVTNGSGGTITADGTGTIIYLEGRVLNQGTIIAQNSGEVMFVVTRGGYGTPTTNLGTVQAGSGGHVYLNGTFDNNSTRLATASGAFEINDAVIYGGSFAPGSIGFTRWGGDLYGVTIEGDLTFAADARVTFYSNTTFTGANATFEPNAKLYWQQTGTLAGKTLTFASGSHLYLSDNQGVITLAPDTIATGEVRILADGTDHLALTNQGTITNTSGTGYVYANTFTNTGRITASNGSTLYVGNLTPFILGPATNGPGGTITADGAKSVVYLYNNIANQGTFIAQNSGQLIFNGDFRVPWTTSNFGAIQLVNGGHAYLAGRVNNTGATLNAPSGGPFELYGGSIENGTVTAGALTFTSSGGMLSNTTLTGNLVLPTSAIVGFTGGATFTGPTATLGPLAQLRWWQSGTLADKAITFGSASSISINSDALTFGPTTTATGDIKISGTSFTNQGTIVHNSGTGFLFAPTLFNSGTITATSGAVLSIGNPYSNYAITNGSGGAITADGTNTLVQLYGNIFNQGTLIAKNSGQLFFRSEGTPAMLTANLGTIQIANGGHVYLGGVLDNAGATLGAPTGGSFELYGGTINNGIVASGALAYTSAGGTLNNVTLVGDLTLPANAQVSFTAGTTFSGTNMNLGSSSYFSWLQSGTLDGKVVTFGTDAVLGVDGGYSLALGPSAIMTGTVNIYPSNFGSTITNQGLISHSTGPGNLFAQTFTNSGSIVATGGSLTLGTLISGFTFANSVGGLIRTTGLGIVTLQAPGAAQIINNGTIDVRSGTLTTNNHLTNGAGGVISGSGTIVGNVTAASGTIAPGNSIGTLTFQNGTLNVTSASVFAVELAGATSDQLVFNNPPSAVSLGTGLLTLSLTLLAPPTEGTTYNLIRIDSGGNGITGTFAGLPSSGNTITAIYADTTYTFGVNYATNLVSLNFATIPEPSTYLLLGAGAVLLALWRRRR